MLLLPLEILFLIFSYLEARDILALTLVNKEFRNLLINSKLQQLFTCRSGKLLEKAPKCWKIKLCFSGQKITDVSKLGNVHTLGLSYTKVTDVSKLGNVHDLELISTSVTDVSMLGNVHTLNLSNTQVKDFSMLKNTKVTI